MDIKTFDIIKRKMKFKTTTTTRRPDGTALFQLIFKHFMITCKNRDGGVI